jgi:hypothetical protein
MGILLITRYGEFHLSDHAVARWRERTGRSYPELVEAVATARRPTKRELRRIHKLEAFRPKRLLECDCAYFIIISNVIVTVYLKTRKTANENERVEFLPNNKQRGRDRRAKRQLQASRRAVDQQLILSQLSDESTLGDLSL